LAITEDGTTLYVLNNRTPSISVIDVASNTVTGTIASDFGGNPGFLAIHGSCLYHPHNFGGNSFSLIEVLPIAAGCVTAEIPVGSFPSSMAIIGIDDDSSPFKSHAAISGGAINIAAGSTVNGDLAAQAAVVIGANALVVHNIYAGAAVTTGALSTVGNIFSGAAAGIGANANALNIHAGAAITIGASGRVEDVYAGAAITLGEGASTVDVLAADANADQYAEAGDIHNSGNMAEVITLIKDTQSDLSDLVATPGHSLYTTMGTQWLAPGVWEGSALSIAASSTLTFDASADPDASNTNHVWVINLSEALTVGAGTHFEIAGLNDGDTATIIWNVGAAVTLGAGTSFRGTAFVGGPVNAATSSVSCGHLYATGAISVGSIGVDSSGNPVTCENSDAAFTYLVHLIN
jgi:YVTN family beta-propeller protein